VSGVAGYTLSRHGRFAAGTAWTGGAIWWQVAVGAALLVLAAWFWRSGRRRLART
jgi:membrane protein implicated in regulation of membrane protease activity